MKILFIQLPIPQQNFGRRTGNIPLGAACIKQAADISLSEDSITIMPESISSYLGDAALIDWIISKHPDVIGFTVYAWNIERSLYLSREIKSRICAKIIFGGPEVTPDNAFINSEFVDFCVFGEGEAAFIHLIKHPDLWSNRYFSETAEPIFCSARSPYLTGLLEPEIEDMMALETQRGCPFRCGYCYYNKSLGRVAAAPDHLIQEAFRWAFDRGLSEVFLLDPSLNARSDLETLIKGLADINRSGSLSLLSEIRADYVTQPLADLFAQAGFCEFEIGLQTTHPPALTCMNRPTDLKKFCYGVKALQHAGIRTKIDLIIGLPGDTLESFKSTVQFVSTHQMQEDIQIFFLSVLPGTEFRKNSRKLGLQYDPRPPYSIIETPNFKPDEMREAFFYAEDVFDIALHPEPDMDLSYRAEPGVRLIPARSALSSYHEETYYSKLIVDQKIDDNRIQRVSRKLTHPYQIFFMPQLDDTAFMFKLVEVLTRTNPQTPLEIVMFEHELHRYVDSFEQAVKLDRPLYLDLDLPAFGSRSVLYTLVSADSDHRFGGIMKRQAFWWKQDRLPQQSDMESLMYLDGILIDGCFPVSDVQSWQNEYAPVSDSLPHISFADIRVQERWTALIGSGDYVIAPEEL